MLLIKVLLTLFVCQKYSVGRIFQDNALSTMREELQTDGDSTTQPDEIQTTVTDDDELTTKPDEIQTTESGECPSDKSLFSKKDVKDIIDYIFNELSLNDTMKQHIEPRANSIKGKHTEDFQQFENWFISQPEHLIHVLEGLSVVRKQKIEPEAQKIAEVLKDYPQVKENIDEKLLKHNKFTKMLNKYENLCKYNCEDQKPEPNHIFKRSIPDDHLCISIADLHKDITKDLSENFEGFLTKMNEKLIIADEKLTEAIENMKTELKERALKEFGRTMYDVLKLEDEYHHFAKEMNSTNIQILMYTVKEVGLQIDSKLLELQRLLKDYGDYCRSCNKDQARFVRQTNLIININEEPKLLHELIQEKYNESEIEVNNIIEEAFKDLNNIINDSERKEKYLSDLKLKQQKIEEAEDIERQGLEYLKSMASHASMKNLSDLASKSQNLLKEIDEMITHLKKILT